MPSCNGWLVTEAKSKGKENCYCCLIVSISYCLLQQYCIFSNVYCHLHFITLNYYLCCTHLINMRLRHVVIRDCMKVCSTALMWPIYNNVHANFGKNQPEIHEPKWGTLFGKYIKLRYSLEKWKLVANERWITLSCVLARVNITHINITVF
jgi:hypothetical protein